MPQPLPLAALALDELELAELAPEAAELAPDEPVSPDAPEPACICKYEIMSLIRSESWPLLLELSPPMPSRDEKMEPTFSLSMICFPRVKKDRHGYRAGLNPA